TAAPSTASTRWRERSASTASRTSTASIALSPTISAGWRMKRWPSRTSCWNGSSSRCHDGSSRSWGKSCCSAWTGARCAGKCGSAWRSNPSDTTARNGGELELKLRAPRRSNLKVLLLLDVGGSMDPHSQVCERLFSAARRATHFKELQTFYFHNCIYGRVYDSAGMIEGTGVLPLLQRCDPSWP